MDLSFARFVFPGISTLLVSRFPRICTLLFLCFHGSLLCSFRGVHAELSRAEPAKPAEPADLPESDELAERCGPIRAELSRAEAWVGLDGLV